jgi:phage antirepressor YoqD-like protein
MGPLFYIRFKPLLSLSGLEGFFIFLMEIRRKIEKVVFLKNRQKNAGPQKLKQEDRCINSPGLKDNAARLALEKRIKLNDLAKDLDIGTSALNKWMSPHRKGYLTSLGGTPRQKEVKN